MVRRSYDSPVTTGEENQRAAIESVPRLVRDLYETIDSLSELFPGRPFTPDGHLVGSLGEVLAAWEFDLELAPPSNAGFDATTLDGKLKVEIKATSRRSIGLGTGRASYSDRLIALLLDREHGHEVIYNGPSAPVWEAAGKPQRNGQQTIGITKLRAINAEIEASDRIPRRDELDGHDRLP